MIDKASLRRQMRIRRRALDGPRQREAATRLTDTLTRQALFMSSSHVAFYVANDGEIDPRPALERALALGKRCYLPVLAPSWQATVMFGRVDRNTRFTRNRFGIPEPDVAPGRLRRAPELDLVLVPLVAFDAQGNRIGMGGGFYDRTLAYLGTRRCWHRPRLLGLAHALQRVERVCSDAWDIPLEGIVTDRGVYPARACTETDRE